jgi:hypothetical protein
LSACCAAAFNAKTCISNKYSGDKRNDFDTKSSLSFVKIIIYKVCEFCRGTDTADIQAAQKCIGGAVTMAINGAQSKKDK